MKPLYLLALAIFLFSSCSAHPVEEVPQLQVCPSTPADLPLSEDGQPILSVYIAEEDRLQEMGMETYLEGVVAGEMKNTWPIEALKAQAILARTFALRFLGEKESRYPGADISTDITEAQAYRADAVNDRVRQAVQETAGLVLAEADGTLPYTWFHAHSGGTTDLARNALGWTQPEPSYTRITDGLDSDDAPANVRFWTACFTEEDFLDACHRAGLQLSTLDTLRIAETSPSGRAVTLLVNDVAVNAARLRLELGSTLMRSTLLTDLRLTDGQVLMSGRGYGHGVGMPQWGAYALAQDGWRCEDIALHYYHGLQVVKVW